MILPNNSFGSLVLFTDNKKVESSLLTADHVKCSVH